MRQLSALSGGTLRMGAQEILLKADLVLHFGIVMIEEVRVLLTDLTKAEHMVSHLEGAIHHHPADPDNPDLSSFLVEIVLLVAFRVKVEQALVVGQHILMQNRSARKRPKAGWIYWSKTGPCRRQIRITSNSRTGSFHWERKARFA